MFELAVLCVEKHGTHSRIVTEVGHSRAVHSYVVSFAPELKGQVEKFRRIFLVDDVGVLAQGPLMMHGFPDVHIHFWDKILRGRESMCLLMLEVVATDAGARGVFTAIPKASRVTLAFAKRLGFEQVLEDDRAVVLERLIT